MKSTLRFFLTFTFAFLALNSFAQQKVGYMNTDMLIVAMPERDSAIKQLDAMQKEFRETAETMQVEFNTKLKAFEDKKESYTESMRAQKEKELNELYQRMQEYPQVAQSSLEEKQQKLFAPIQDKITKTISKVAKANGIAYVISSAALLFADDTQMTDVLPLAKKELGLK